MKKLAALLVVCFLLFIIPAAVTAKNTDKFNEKFEFTGVSLDDGTTAVTDGIIEAGSKSVDHSDLTVCGYYTPDWDFLGQFQSSDFSSENAGDVENFCVQNFGNRQ